MTQLTFNDLYQMRRRAQEIGWEDRYLKWHIWEPAIKDEVKRVGIDGFIQMATGVIQDTFLGLPATIYPEHAHGEMFSYDLILENTKLTDSNDAFVLKVPGVITLKKWWIVWDLAS